MGMTRPPEHVGGNEKSTRRMGTGGQSMQE